VLPVEAASSMLSRSSIGTCTPASGWLAAAYRAKTAHY